MNATAKKVVAVSELSGAQKRIAARAIEDVHLAFYEKGGLRETLEQAERQAGGVSAHIYKLAVYAAKNTRTLKQAADLFSALCRHAEETYKAEHGIENLKDPVKGLPVWSVFKSNILGAMRSGLSPLDYKNEKALREARMEKMRALPRRAPEPEREAGEAAPLDEVESWLETTTIHDSLRALTSLTVVNLEYVKPSKRDEAAAIMREANEKLAELVDKRRVQAAGVG